MIQVSIIIVNYNTCDLLKNCINSIYEKTSDVDFEIIVVDNYSTDNSVQMIKDNFSDIVLIQNKENLGFGAANNIGLKHAKGKYIFYLNSDVILLNNSVKYFYDYWENNKNSNIGSLGSILLDNKLMPIHSFGNFSSFTDNIKDVVKLNIINTVLSFLYIFHISSNTIRKYKKVHIDIPVFDNEKQVDFITGADLFMLNNNDALFDEDFCLYFEDTELQYRLKNKNLKRLIIKGPEIIHLCGGSVDSNYSIKRKCTFSRIQYELSRIIWIKKRYNNNFFLKSIMKIFIIINWINPILFSKTKYYLKKLISI